jgi:serine phosphatase RsbU (regulator of sigma subunit)
MNTAVGYVTLDRNGSAVNGQWHLRAANAGLIAPLIRRKNGDVEWLDVRGLPLGAVEGLEYCDKEQHVCPGDFIVLTSDGIVEAMDAQGEMYGFDRLVESVATADCQDARSMMGCVLDNVNRFVDNAEIHDDLTMVVVVIE